MKLLTLGSTAVLSLLLGAPLPGYAQETPAQQERPQGQRPVLPDQKPEQKPDQPEEKRAQPEQKQERQENQVQKEEKREEHGQKEEKRVVKEEKREVKVVRIPEEHFRAHFGRTHVFRINRPVIVAGVPRFQFGGYWFGIAEPWPVGWYYTDEVYVDYIEGVYYLINPVRPGVRIVVNVIP